MPELDCRDEVFRERGHEVLGSVVQGTQIAYPDPFDVEELHLEARQAFNETLDNIRSSGTSKILLISGEAGCGKTHLIRALRAQTHRQRGGVIAYVHMTSEHGDYRQYLLRQVVRSLADPYVHFSNHEQISALDLISDALAESSGLESGAAENLHEADDAALAGFVSDYADALSEARDAQGNLRYANVDLNTLRIFLYRQSTRKPIQRRVNSFLNGDPLSAMDWQKLAALPADCDRGPMYLLGQLGRIVPAALGSPLVICVDQIEASDITGKNHDPFLRAMSTAVELIETVPGLMVLLSCLDSAYEAHAPYLIKAYRHRIEHEPSPVTLRAGRSADEIRKVVSRRLKGLYEGVGLEHVPPDSVHPLPEDLPARLNKQHLRVVLQQIYRYWQQCHQADSIVAWQQETPDQPPVAETDTVDRLRLAWNEFKTAGEHKVAEDEAAHLDLLVWALKESPSEMPDRTTVVIDPLPASAGGMTPISFAVTQTGAAPVQRLIGLCEKDARGNGLYNQVAALEALCKLPGQNVAIIRSTRFPKSGKLADHLAELQRAGGIYQVIDESCWEKMQAMRDFVKAGSGGFAPEIVAEWRKSDMPLAGLPELRAIMQTRPATSTAVSPPKPPTPPVLAAATPAKKAAPKPATKTVAEGLPMVKPDPAFMNPLLPPTLEIPVAVIKSAGPLHIGKTEGFSPTDVLLDPQTLTRHTAIFGANGSGKTVLAMTIIEMLLERGISVILFDRKGDLATYAVEKAWEQKTGAPNEETRRRALRERLDIHLYTPGSANGRPLVLPLLPIGLDKLDESDRQEQSRQAALILSHVCSPAKAKADMYAAVLAKAIELICTSATPHTLDNLEHVLLTSPQELLDRLPAHTSKHCEEVGRRLNERRVAHGRLFSEQGEKLDLHQMLLESKPGHARLNIICTQFFDEDSSLVWIAQFLAAAGKFIQGYPSKEGRLQGLLMFDEADKYVPARSKPVTKPGMENLLRRARASGLGIMLATQSTGDFDYNALVNISTVFAGKLAAETAAEKLRPRFGDVVDKLARKSIGQFIMGTDTEVREIKGQMSLIKPATVERDEIERLASLQQPR